MLAVRSLDERSKAGGSADDEAGWKAVAGLPWASSDDTMGRATHGPQCSRRANGRMGGSEQRGGVHTAAIAARGRERESSSRVVAVADSERERGREQRDAEPA
jgi:hypothetical protein